MSKASSVGVEESIGDNDRDYRKNEFLGEIVSASTFAPPGNEIDTTLRCRKRPERKQCSGLIRVYLQEKPAELRWWCPVCGDGGVINSWKGIPWKKNHIKSVNKNKRKECCKILLPFKDFELLKGIPVLEPGAESIVQSAVSLKDGVLLMGTIDCIDNLIGYIAFEANHEQQPRRQRMLNRLFDQICTVIKGKW